MLPRSTLFVDAQLGDGVGPSLWGVHPILALLGLAGCATMPRDIQSRRYDWFDIRQAKEILIGKPPHMVVHTIGDNDVAAGNSFFVTAPVPLFPPSISSSQVKLLAHDSDFHYRSTVAEGSSQISSICVCVTIAPAMISSCDGAR